MMKNTKARQATLTLESLEGRTVLSATSAFLSYGIMYVYTNNADSNVTVSQSGSSIVVHDYTNGFDRSFAASAVKSLTFVGGAGNDRVVDNVSWLGMQAWGYGGNDYLEGYNAIDNLYGGAGNDTLKGYGNVDTLFGEDGVDTMYGGEGNDFLNGGNSHDYMYGEGGNDSMDGRDGGYDYIYGGAGRDTFYEDRQYYFGNSGDYRDHDAFYSDYNPYQGDRRF